MGKFFMLQRKKWSIEKFGVLPKLRELTIDGGWKPRPPTPHLACLPHCMQQSHLKEGMCGAHFRRAGLFPLHCSILLEGRFGGEWPISSCPAESFPTPSGPYVDGGKGVRKTQLGHIDVEWGGDSGLTYRSESQEQALKWRQRCSAAGTRKVVCDDKRGIWRLQIFRVDL